MTGKVMNLLRTNAALALLCAIALMMAFGFIRGDKNIEPREIDEITHQPKIKNTTATSTDGTAITPVVTASPDDLAQSPLRDMPAPSFFNEFEYSNQKSITSTSTCSDEYRVTVIYPAAVDYRADPSSALYNLAASCEKGKIYVDVIDLTDLKMASGTSYYLIRANEGLTGIWHDPY